MAITLDAIKANVIGESKKEPFTEVEWFDMSIVVREHISFNEVNAFVNAAVAAMYSDEGEFLPELREFVIKKLTLAAYTDIEVGEEVDEWYDIIYSTDLMETISPYIDGEQYTNIIYAIDAKIMNINANHASEAMARLNAMADEFSDAMKKIDAMASAISPDDMAKLVGTITNGGFDPNKIISAYVEAEKR